MGFSNVDVFVNDTTPQKAAVSGVTVKVLSQDGKLTFTQTVTDGQGHAGFLLPDSQQYQLRLYKFGVQFDQPLLFTVLPEPLTPPDTNTFDVSAVLITPPVPTDPRLCTAFGFFRDVTGAPQANLQIHIIAKFNPTWVDGSGVLKERVIVQTDASGYAQVNLFRNGQYECTVQGEEDFTRLISVPDAPNVNLPDLLFPVVALVETVPPAPFVVPVGKEVTIGLTLFGSDGSNLGLAFGDVFIKTSDQGILGFTMAGPTGITLQGVAPGTAQILIMRADLSIVRIPDAGIVGQPLNVTVTP